MWLGRPGDKTLTNAEALSAGSQTFEWPRTFSWLHVAAEDVCSLSPDKIADGVEATN